MSDIRTWLDCPRKFWLQTLQGLRPGGDKTDQLEVSNYRTFDPAHPEELNEEVVVQTREANRRDEGTMVHAVTEAYYRGDLPPNWDPMVLRGAAQGFIEAKAEELSDNLATESWAEAVRYATAMATGYVPWVQREGHDVGKKVLAVEERMTWDFEATYAGTTSPYHTIRVTGQPDHVEQDTITSEIGIGDTKTVSSLKKGGPRAHDFQLTAYAWLYWKNHGRMPTYGYQNLIARSLQTARATPPFYRRVPITIGAQSLRQFTRFMEDTIVRIENMIADTSYDPRLIPYNEGPLCTQFKCGVLPLCDAMSSGSPVRWKELANQHFGGSYEELYDD
ncbi:MAG: PD-(D/E)XK nuclease family protein [bacterium]|nr:PD-(D/E)XK nuclease family protein [bacterium]